MDLRTNPDIKDSQDRTRVFQSVAKRLAAWDRSIIIIIIVIIIIIIIILLQII